MLSYLSLLTSLLALLTMQHLVQILFSKESLRNNVLRLHSVPHQPNAWQETEICCGLSSEYVSHWQRAQVI